MSRNRMKLDLQGFSGLLERIQRAQGEIDQAATHALERGAEPFVADLKAGIAKHRQTGLTESSLNEPKVVRDGHRLTLNAGFDLAHGGLPALFLEYGTPRMKPDPFIQKALKRNQKTARSIQESTLTKILEGLEK